MPAHATARILRSGVPLRPYPQRVTDDLERWAAATPDAPFIGERRGERWETIAYAAMLDRARRAGGALLAAGGTAERPLAVIAENGIDHAAVVLGAMYAGVPASPISTGYARAGADPARLRALVDVLRPFAAFVPDAAAAARVRAMLPELDVIGDVAALDGDAQAADRAHAHVGPDTVAKILFTSGSTGTPKGVMTTHRMLCANQTMLEQVWPEATRDPVLVDWAPWSHTAAGNKNFGMVLRNGGTMYVDAGKPQPGRDSRRRCATCARSRRRSTSTSRAAGRCCSRRSSVTTRSRRRSSRASASCSTPARASRSRCARASPCSRGAMPDARSRSSPRGA